MREAPSTKMFMTLAVFSGLIVVATLSDYAWPNRFSLPVAGGLVCGQLIILIAYKVQRRQGGGQDAR